MRQLIVSAPSRVQPARGCRQPVVSRLSRLTAGLLADVLAMNMTDGNMIGFIVIRVIQQEVQVNTTSM